MGRPHFRAKVVTIFVAAHLAVLAMASSAMAVTTYVSKSGNDAFTCTTPSTPCLTIGGALTQATAGGGFKRVVLMGTGVYSESLTLTSPTEIIGDGAGYQAIAPGPGNLAIAINGGTGDQFRIGKIQLLGNSGGSTYGINVLSAGSVDIENVEIHGFGTQAINFATSSERNPTFMINNSVIGDGAGILVLPTGGQFPQMEIRNSVIRNCTNNCVRVDGTQMASGAGPAVNIINSLIFSGTSSNVTAFSTSGGFANINLEGSSSSYGPHGVNSVGQQSEITLDRAVIVNNTIGVADSASGTVISYGNNNINNNTIDVNGSLTPGTLK